MVAPSDGAERIAIQARNRTVPRQSVKINRDSAAITAITRLVQLSSRYAWPVILSFLLLAVVSASYFTGHFAITNDSKKLLSSSLPWRQQEMMLENAFPHRIDQIIAVIDATTPEAADEAADALVNGLAPRSDVIRRVSRPDGGEFFERNGILPSMAIPSTLQDSLMARLDRLAPVKELAQVAACIGREFDHELLAAVSSLQGAALDEGLAKLVQSGLSACRLILPMSSNTRSSRMRLMRPS